jgi:hypothetical protein
VSGRVPALLVECGSRLIVEESLGFLPSFSWSNSVKGLVGWEHRFGAGAILISLLKAAMRLPSLASLSAFFLRPSLPAFGLNVSTSLVFC